VPEGRTGGDGCSLKEKKGLDDKLAVWPKKGGIALQGSERNRQVRKRGRVGSLSRRMAEKRKKLFRRGESGVNIISGQGKCGGPPKPKKRGVPIANSQKELY